MEPKKSSSIIGIPGAIIIAASILAVAFMWTNKSANAPAGNSTGNTNIPSVGTPAAMADVIASDHILGNPNATIKFVEYSDPSCPYCQVFNPVMTRIMNEYGASGNVAWIYRAFPLDKPDQSGNILHPNAGRESEALECAAALGGNSAFWAYEKKWYEVFPTDASQRSADADNAQIASVAASVGVDPVSFNECLASGRFKDKVAKSFLDGVNAGVTGTPFTILITPSGTKIQLVGPQTYPVLKRTIDTLIKG